ncbi:TetR/AcrR family transcriptional regulator [Mangrovihabitans endophyticus]|uniref:TetR family transcriptional regulator n=1 Tax=Mangrovihabitans endophyticus TaxID=1751298 RepID=A0A8J3FMY5_9ACTN|nr:WHG domain-containing protein [Mangrovihabitans endophyticus]GGK79782.1 TetR family transcriptional regulator [Mangrovihabitans endophyticus]
MAGRRTLRRSNYHHGDLRAALIAAGIVRARAGGPQAIVLREVTRIVGVAPNSAYAHFATLAELKWAVADEALREMAAAMAAHLDTVASDEPSDPVAGAQTHLREVGRAYVYYAIAEPGLFRTAMGGKPSATPLPGEPGNGPEDDGRLVPDALLLRSLARLTDVGYLDPTDQAQAVVACWAIVHGLALMLLDLLPPMSADEQNEKIDAALDVLVTGLASPLNRRGR